MYHKSMRNVSSGNELREGAWQNKRVVKTVSEGKMPPARPGSIPAILLPVSSQKVNLRRVELGGIQQIARSQKRESGLAVIRGDGSRERTMEKGVRGAMNHEKRLVNPRNHDAKDAAPWKWGREEFRVIDYAVTGTNDAKPFPTLFVWHDFATRPGSVVASLLRILSLGCYGSPAASHSVTIRGARLGHMDSLARRGSP